MTGSGYLLVPFKETPLEAMLTLDSPPLENGFMYYSTAIDSRSLIQENNLINISTQFLLYDDQNSSPYRPSLDSSDYKYHPHTFHYYEESFRSINFYVNFAELLPYPGPDRLEILMADITDSSILQINDDVDSEYRHQMLSFRSQILERVYTRPPGKDIEDMEITIPLTEYKDIVICFYRLNLFLGYLNTVNKTISSKNVYLDRR